MFAVHIRWGDSEAAREKELSAEAEWLEAKRKAKHSEDQDILIVGDFNTGRRTDRLYQAITSRGLKLPAVLAKNEFGTGLVKGEKFDQILCRPSALYFLLRLVDSAECDL
jgi:hypothetical protein